MGKKYGRSFLKETTLWANVFLLTGFSLIHYYPVTIFIMGFKILIFTHDFYSMKSMVAMPQFVLFAFLSHFFPNVPYVNYVCNITQL